MVKVHAFKGIYFNEERVGSLSEVIAPPYDVISDELKKALYERHENNVIRLILGENVKENQEKRLYEKASEYFNEWLNKGILLQDKKESVYVLEQVFKVNESKKSRKGLILLVELEPNKKEVFAHEKTLSEPKKDRLELIRATKAVFDQIFCLYSEETKKIRETINNAVKGKPFLEAVDDKGIENRVWRISEENEVNEIKNAMKKTKLFIADGHHRHETALNYFKENPEADKALMFVVDTKDKGLVVLPTHRLIKDLNQFNEEKFLEKLKQFFEVSETSKDFLLKEMRENSESHCFGVCTKRKTFLIKSGKGIEEQLSEENPFLKELDVTVLHEIVLEKILGISKEMVSRREKIDYVKDLSDAIKAVDSGKAQVAFILYPTKVEQVKKVAENGARMPQKSTYFYPKVLSGLIMNKIG